MRASATRFTLRAALESEQLTLAILLGLEAEGRLAPACRMGGVARDGLPPAQRSASNKTTPAQALSQHHRGARGAAASLRPG